MSLVASYPSRWQPPRPDEPFVKGLPGGGYDASLPCLNGCLLSRKCLTEVHSVPLGFLLLIILKQKPFWIDWFEYSEAHAVLEMNHIKFSPPRTSAGRSSWTAACQVVHRATQQASTTASGMADSEHTHTHNHFTAGLEYVRVHPGQQVPER